MGLFKSLTNRKPKYTCASCHKIYHKSLISTTLGGMCRSCFEFRFKKEVTEKIVEVSKDKSYVVKELES